MARNLLTSHRQLDRNMNSSSLSRPETSSFWTAAQTIGRAYILKAILVVGLLGILVGLLWGSLLLAAGRMYQVDECMEVYVARTLTTATDKAVAGHVTLFQILLSAVISSSEKSADVLASARLVMVQLFWVNWVLLAMATGARPLSFRWLVALVGAATLTPLWDYGFEVRHDNLLLAGVLAVWGIVRFQPLTIWSGFALGAVTVVLEFVAFKAFVYTLPLSIAILLFPQANTRTSWIRAIIAWLVGCASAFLVIRIALEVAGLWKLYLAAFGFLTTVSGGARHYSPWVTLSRLATQTPLLLALVLAGLVAVITDLRRRGKAALAWDGALPEGLLCLGAFAALLINPVPYPYNLIHFVPFAYIFAFRYVSDLLKEIGTGKHLVPVMVSVLIFAHVVPFGIATRRHWNRPSTDQEAVMTITESLTDPAKDPFYDGIGLVSTRSVMDTRGFLLSMNLESFLKGPGPQVREMLAARPAAVIIPNYRTDWLPEEDHAFIASNYVTWPMTFGARNGAPTRWWGFQIIHPGRYRLAPREASDLAGTYPCDLISLSAPPLKMDLPGTLDGKPLTGKPVELTVGTHRIDCPTNFQPAVMWLGPRLDRLPRLGQRNHRTLFVNWY
jgi:hypothetical protein